MRCDICGRKIIGNQVNVEYHQRYQCDTFSATMNRLAGALNDVRRQITEDITTVVLKTILRNRDG